MKRIFPFSILILLILKIAVLSSGCANIIPPTGGPKDTLPPVLVRANPPDSSKGFKEKTITLSFDEYVELDAITENLIVSPTPGLMPRVDRKLKNVIIKISDTLEANTTYYYNFGKSIKDVNEGNVFQNFSYIFSTGQTIDSLELTGKVVLAETGAVDSTLIVMLHKNSDDSAVAKELPRYITKLNGKGEFRFRFLPAGTFYPYAMKDESGIHKFTGNSQLFAFTDKPVEIQPGVSPITLYASAEKKETSATTAPLTVNRAANRTEDRRLKFTTNLINNLQGLLNDFILSFEQPLKNFDPGKLLLSTDTAYTPEKNYSWQPDSLYKKFTLKTSLKEDTRYNLILDKEFAADSAGRKLLKTDTLKFTTRKLTDYGALKINFTNLDLTKNPVLLFMVAGTITNSFPVTASSFTQALFNPGEYELKFFYDENKNGKWDPGDYWQKRKQPEIVRPLLEKKINIKSNWDNEFDITL